MTTLENVWIISTITILFFILSTEPKTASSSGSKDSRLNRIFSSESEGQKALKTFMQIIIICFYTLSLLISFY